ncbi:MAG TPA: NAD(P)/FAD-dependent oxidoreductase [Pyrinomonadaceae bacterium]|jgi:phytoene dehydrogenase-like protein|nr:NAD(P)/FAD-dependent oxidoreductase [Pyrinomonadaceae bacterium]
MNKRDIIIIGAGHNGLVAAYYLAKAGMKPLVLERREVLGGVCVTEVFHPGFRCSTLATSAGSFLPQLIDDLQLVHHGLQFIIPPIRVFALNHNGPPICIYETVKDTVSELSLHSKPDSEKFFEFLSCFDRLGRALRPLLTMTPPNISAPTKSELWNLGKLGWKIRGLGKNDEYRLLRYGPMAVADLAAEWFENETLRAVVAARGIFGAFAGPWSAGTCAPLLMQSALNGSPIAPTVFVKGGMGALTQALAQAATAAGAEILTNSEVAGIQIKDERVTSVVLSSGEEIETRAVVSNADPKSTFLNLVDAAVLDPGFLQKIGNYRAHGTVAMVHLALAGLPEFANSHKLNLLGRIHIGPDIDYLERAFDAAKYGDFSSKPFMEVTMPALTDASLAPSGGLVMSIHAQYTPYKLKNGDWHARREELGDAIVNALSEYAPNLKELIVERKVLTPLDLEREFALTGGHIHHGEMSLDQLFAFRPLIGCAQYRTPIKGLYLCGSGTHPGGGVTGASGLNASREVIKDAKQK